MGTSYLVASGSTLLFTASLSEILGRSPVLFASVLVFTVGTIVCCNAHSIGTMIAGRSIQGLGGGGIIVLCICIFADLMPLKLRPKWFGLIQLSWAFGTIAGPLIGGALGTASLWRWVFYIMFPFCAIGLVGVPLFVRLEPRKATLSEMLSRVDWFGGILFIPSAIGFLVALCWGGSQQPWGSWRTLVALIVGVAGLCGTVLWVWLGAKEPFIRRSIFHSTSSFIIYAISFVHGIIVSTPFGNVTNHTYTTLALRTRILCRLFLFVCTADNPRWRWNCPPTCVSNNVTHCDSVWYPH
jgi:MFS family permease